MHANRGLLICTMLIALAAGRTPALADTWEWQNPLPQGNTLRDVGFVNSTTGFAVGDGETILETTDGGVHWLLAHGRSTQHHFVTLQMLDAQVGWLIEAPSDPTDPTATYRVQATSDGWTTWAPVYESAQPVYAMHWIDGSRGWVGTAQGMYHTDNGGQTWNPILNATPVQSVFFLDSDTGWGSSGATVYRTQDGGQSWDSTAVSGMVDAAVDEIQFVTPRDGWLIEQEEGYNYEAGRVFASQDSGATWNEQLFIGGSFGPYDHFSDIQMVDGQHGFACSSDGAVFGTADAGTTWTEVDSLHSVSTLDFTDATTGWSVGALGTIRHTADGGATWSDQQTGPRVDTPYMARIQFLDPRVGFVTGEQSLLSTTDGGATWQSVPIAPPTSYAVSISASYFLDAQRGWIAWDNNGRLQYTDDGGQTVTTTADSLGRCFDIQFLNDTIGWAAGQRFHRTTDGGQHWVEYAFPSPPYEIYSICFVDSLEGWLGGEGGTILHTSDGGQSWTQQDLGQNAYVRSVAFVDSQVGVAVGYYNDEGLVFRTTDGGDTWDPVMTVPNTMFAGGIAPLDNYLYVVGRGFSPQTISRFYASTDAGATWTEKTDVPLADGILGVAAVDPWHMWLLGPGGVIAYGPLGNDPTGVANTPSPFVLLQNYPNPFNPRTTIAYRLGSAAVVELTIYDVRGDRVRHWTPVRQDAGPHRVAWDGRDDDGRPVASGLYFYRLKSDGVAQARKMLLLK